jgi:hypothetical protein
VSKTENIVSGIPIDPKLPARFDDTPNEERPTSHQRWWNRPYIRTETIEQNDAFYANRTDEYAEEGRKSWAVNREKWLAAWPGGIRYEVRCLDGGAWDRSTAWGMFPTIEEAVACAKAGPPWKGSAPRCNQREL